MLSRRVRKSSKPAQGTALWVPIVVALIGFAGTIISVRLKQNNAPKFERETPESRSPSSTSRQTLPKTPSTPSPVAKLQIISPKPLALVSDSVLVVGSSPYLSSNGWHTYLIVEGPAGGPVVQQARLNPDQEGNVSGNAIIGSGSVGIGATFVIRLLATRTLLQPGALIDAPDGNWSSPVSVIRQ